MMKCYHALTSAPVVTDWPMGCHWLQIGNYWLLVHEGGNCSKHASDRMPHLLSGKNISAQAAALLASYGVTTADTIASAAIKVGAVWHPAMP